MKEYFLKVRDNGSLVYLSIFEDNKETILIEKFKEATKKGWESKKPIFESIEILFKESDNDLIISEASAMYLFNKYSNILTKSFTSWKPDSKSIAILELCKRINDPYDRG